MSQKSQSTVIKTLVRDLNLNYVKPKRAGVIVYTHHKGTTYFCLGLDSKTHDLTDFGGSVMLKHETAVEGALREFDEETLSVFERIVPSDISHCPVLYDSQNMIIFLNMNLCPDTACKKFKEKFREEVKKGHCPEVCGITWITWSDFQSMISGRCSLYIRVKNFLKKAGDFSYLL